MNVKIEKEIVLLLLKTSIFIHLYFFLLKNDI